MSSILENTSSNYSSCFFVFVTEAEGTPLEKDFISKLKMLSNAVGKKFVLIITEDNIRDRFNFKTVDKKSKHKGGSKGTKSGSLKLPIMDQGFHEVIIKMIQDIVFEYMHSLNNSNRNITEPSLTNIDKNVKKKRKSSDQVEIKIELDNLLDDRPPMCPDLFVVLVGFTDPQFFSEFQNRNLPLKCVVKVQETDVSTKKSNSSVQPFWETVDHQTLLHSTNFFVLPLHVFPALLDNINYIYDVLCCVLYDIVDTVKKYAEYQEKCQVYTLDYVKLENTAIYDDLMSDIPLECVNVEYVLHCIIEQVVDFDEKYYKNANIEETENDSDMSILSSVFIRNRSPPKHCPEKEKLDQSSNRSTSSSFLNAEDQLPCVLKNINENSKYLSRTFFYRDRCARNLFHLENFTELYLSLSRTIQLSVQHLKKIPADLPAREKSFFTFHLNRLLKHVKSHLPFIAQRHVKYYIELLYYFKCMDNSLSLVSHDSDDTENYIQGNKCLQKVHEKYEQLSNIEESHTDWIGVDQSFNPNNDNNHIHCLLEALWDIYVGRKNQQLEELKKIITLKEFITLIYFLESTQITNLISFPLVNIQLEHFDDHVLAQVLHEERFFHQKCELKYFAPTDSFLVIFYSLFNHYEEWSSRGRIPSLMNIQAFFNFKVSKPRMDKSEEEITSSNSSHFKSEIFINEKMYKENETDSPDYCYDIGESAETLTESELLFNEAGHLFRIKKFTLNSGDFISVSFQFEGVSTIIYGQNKAKKLNGENFSVNNPSENSGMSTIDPLYCFDASMRFVLTDTTIITVSKETHKFFDHPIVTSFNGSNSTESPMIDTLNFTITLPNGLVIESYQLQDETVIRQTFLQDLNKEFCRYYFKNGKVIVSHSNGSYHVYHGNGDETHCEGIKIDVQNFSEEEQIQLSTDTLAKKGIGQKKDQDSNGQNIRIPEKPREKCVKIDTLEYLNALGNFKRIDRSVIIEEYSKYSYKYACSLLSGELYLSREDGLSIYFLDTDKCNTMITKFNNTLTFTSEYHVRDDEEYVSDVDEDDILSEPNFNVQRNDQTDLLGSGENSNHSFISKYSNVGKSDGFVLIDQTWRVEAEQYAPITFKTNGICEIHLPNLKLYYQTNRVQIVAESIEVNAQGDSIRLERSGKDGPDRVFLNWSGITDDVESLIRAYNSGASRFCLSTSGTPSVNKFDEHLSEKDSLNLNSNDTSIVSENTSISSLSSKCFVVNRDGSGYEFMDSAEINKHKKIHKTFQTVQYTLPYCKELFQTNIQRKVEPIYGKFLLKPTYINPVMIKRGDLKFSQKNSNGWLFYPNYTAGRCDPPVKLKSTLCTEHFSIELRKFEQIVPANVDIFEILRSAFEDYCNEGSSICDQFEVKLGN